MILGLDLAQKTGWCLRANGKVVASGMQDFTKKRGESNGLLFLKFRKWFESMLLNSNALNNDSKQREKLAWAAGLFDGEGSTGTYQQSVKEKLKSGETKKYDYQSVQMGIAQTDTRVLKRFQEAIGVGVICGPYSEGRDGNPKRKGCYAWKVSGVERVRKTLELIWPWLGEVKREQAEKALATKIAAAVNPHKPVPRFGIVVYEQPHHRGGHATELLLGMVSVVQEVCALWNVEIATVHTATLKKHACGSGRTEKGQMIKAAARILGRPPVDDNEADAVHVAAWAEQEFVSTRTDFI